ncbi:TPA: fimbrial protein, partial [Escherichia coli]|nr:fimbrial protein [Escherichia coli]
MRKAFSFCNIITALRGCILFTLIMAYSQPSFALLCRNNQTGQVSDAGDFEFRVHVSPEIKFDHSITLLDLYQLV